MKKIIFIALIISLTSVSIYYLYCVNISNFSTNVNNKVKIINTAFFNKVINKDEIVEEEVLEILDKEDDSRDVIPFIDTKDTKSNVEEKSIDQNEEDSKEVSTIVKEDSQKVEVKDLKGVYVGLKFEGSMTAYGKDCCGSDIEKQGITATGFDLKTSLTYSDPVYGDVKIIASDKNFKYYSIIKITDPIDGAYNAIVLDRAGSVIGLDKTKKFDLAVESEDFASHSYGVHKNVSFEVLRVGK